MNAGAGPDVQQTVGRANGFLVVLHHNNCIAQIAQVLKSADQPGIVALVQADARLVQHVKHAHQPGAYLGGQTDALGLAAAEGGGTAQEVQVIQADILQELQAGADFFKDHGGNFSFFSVKLQALEPCQGVIDRQAADIHNRLVLNGDGQNFRLEAQAVAGVAGLFLHETFDIAADKVTVGLFMAALQIGHHTFVSSFKRAAQAQRHPVFLTAGAVHDFFEVLGF